MTDYCPVQAVGFCDWYTVKEWVLVWFDRRRPRVLRISIARFRAYHHIQEYRIETKFNELIFDTQKMIYWVSLYTRSINKISVSTTQ